MKTPFHTVLFKTFHAQRKRIRTNMDEYGLYPGQPKVLRFLQAHENCKLKEIAEECDIECATASKILSSLEENGMLVRNIDQQNKRALQVRITEKGQKSFAKWEAHCKEIEALSLQDFTQTEKEQFIAYLARMYHNLTGRELE